MRLGFRHKKERGPQIKTTKRTPALRHFELGNVERSGVADTLFADVEPTQWDFNQAMAALVADIIQVIPEFSHYRSQQIAISAAYSRSSRRSGVLAYVLPLRYDHGSPVELRKQGCLIQHWAMPVMNHNGEELLYIVYFLLPRFLKLSFRDRLETVIHELYHIHPRFNGDLRRFTGRNRLHGNMKQFDKKVSELTDAYLYHGSSPSLLSVMRCRYDAILKQFGAISAHQWVEPKPKLIKTDYC